MHSTPALPPVAHGLFLGTVAIWAVLELRQAINHRREGVKASWGSEIVFRLAVAAGALLAILFSRVAPAAAFRSAAAAWVGLGLLWCGIALRFWSFRTLCCRISAVSGIASWADDEKREQRPRDQ